MDFWKKLKKEKLLLSVMTMAMVDLLILAIFIVFPLMDYNFKNKETAKSDTENLTSNSEVELQKEDYEKEDNTKEKNEDKGFSGAVSDKYNAQGIEGYNTNQGNGGEAAKDTASASTEDGDDVLIDDNPTTTKDTTVSTEETDSEEENIEDSENSENIDNSSGESSTEGSGSNTTEENQGTEEVTTKENVTDTHQTSTENAEPTNIPEITQ